MKRYRRNELQAREGIDTKIDINVVSSRHARRRNELQAREGIDTFPPFSFVQRMRKVEMSYKPERALTQSDKVSGYNLYDVEMSYKPERALTHRSSACPRQKSTKTYPWIIEPLLGTIAVMIFIYFAFRNYGGVAMDPKELLELIGTIGLVAALILFTAFSQKKDLQEHQRGRGAKEEQKEKPKEKRKACYGASIF